MKFGGPKKANPNTSDSATTEGKQKFGQHSVRIAEHTTQANFLANNKIPFAHNARNASGQKSSGIGNASGLEASGIVNSCGFPACGISGA